MSHIRLITLTTLLLILPSMSVAQPDIASRIDSVVNTALTEGPISAVAVGIMRGNDILYVKAYGLADRQANMSATPAHMFRLSSVSKMFTAAAIVRLAEDGKLSLEDPVSKYVPEFGPRGEQITLTQLLTHTSGLGKTIPRIREQADRLDDTAGYLLGQIKGLPTAFAPGRDWAYSNGAYALLGVVVERVSGRAYSDFVDSLITHPLRLSLTTELSQIPDSLLAKPYDKRGRNLVTGGHGWRIDFASGGYYGTVLDLLQFQRALNSSQIVSDVWLKRMRTPVKLDDGMEVGYGLGLRMGTLDGYPKVGHTGMWGDYTSAVMYYPEALLTVAVLCNTATLNPHAVVIESRIAQLLLATEPPAAETLASEELEKYVGTYNRGDDQIRVSVREGRLFLQGNGEAAQALEYLGDDRFTYGSSSDWQFQFISSGDSENQVMYLHRYWAGVFLDLARRK